MSDLRKAAEMALERLERTIAYSNEEMAKIDAAKHALRQALAQPEQELVAFPDAPTTIYLQVCDDMGCEEPFCEHHEVSWCEDKINNSDVKYIRADTAPPKRERSEQRKWVGLTHEERFLNDCRSPEEIEYAIAIEAKLKEKNT